MMNDDYKIIVKMMLAQVKNEKGKGILKKQIKGRKRKMVGGSRRKKIENPRF